MHTIYAIKLCQVGNHADAMYMPVIISIYNVISYLSLSNIVYNV